MTDREADEVRDDRVDHAEDTSLFYEPGACWWTVSYGPVACALILVIEMATGTTPHWFALTFCATLIAAFSSVQVLAARAHVSVQLTASALRQGAETIPLSAIAAVLPEHGEGTLDVAALQGVSWDDAGSWPDEEWTSARALGELTGVPRRRTGIGLRLREGGLVRAWAKDHRGLRAALTEALRSRADDRGENNGEESA